MPNLISVTQRGPDILDPARSFVNSPVGQEAVGGVRKAGAILKGNPLSLLLSELIFPQAMADGTLKGVTEKHGYKAAPSLVETNAPETYKYHLYKTDADAIENELTPFVADPETEAFLTRQKAQMDAGVSGTFMPGSVSGMR